MLDTADDIARQARQGSVAAIIQVLNEKLADSGVRARAVFADSKLQLLCEAATAEQLEQSVLVERVRDILEDIGPRNIRRVNINSRIVREQQLLWLEEINRDPENQLLWSQEITLARPNLFKQLREDLKAPKVESGKTALPKAASPGQVREKRQFWRGIVGGTGLSLLLLLMGWVIYTQINSAPTRTTQTAQTLTPTNPSIEPDPVPVTPTSPVIPSNEVPATPVPVTPTQQDPFVQAVRLAERAGADGQSAQSQADWLDLAARWQRASDLMEEVPPQDQRYNTARDRTVVYRQNSEAALQEAQKRRPEASPSPSTPSS